MPTLFKITGKNTGKDVSVTIRDSQGTSYNAAELGILTHFEVDSDFTHNKTKSLVNGGQVFHETTPDDVKIDLKFARYSPALENMEHRYRTNSQNGTQQDFTIQYQVRNRDGSINTRTVVNCKPLKFKLGSFNPDKDVDQEVSFVGTEINNND